MQIIFILSCLCDRDWETLDRTLGMDCSDTEYFRSLSSITRCERTTPQQQLHTTPKILTQFFQIRKVCKPKTARTKKIYQRRMKVFCCFIWKYEIFFRIFVPTNQTRFGYKFEILKCLTVNTLGNKGSHAIQYKYRATRLEHGKYQSNTSNKLPPLSSKLNQE